MIDELKQELRELGYTGEFGLSELIEACGERFRGLNKVAFIWHASAWRDKNSKEQINITYPDNPHIAMAKLWLALQNNK